MGHCCSSGSSRIIKEIRMGYGSRALRAFFGVGVIVGIIWLVYVGILADHAMTRTTRRIGQLTQTMEHWKLIGKHKYPIHQDLDIHHVSRRRVPSGPDPIHNRNHAYLIADICFKLYPTDMPNAAHPSSQQSGRLGAQPMGPPPSY